jgi:radical SAM/Cys-rich protein
MKSLKAQGHILSDASTQVALLEDNEMEPFQKKLDELGLLPLRPAGAAIFQVNIGKMCNQTCRHCHVDAGPDRKEIMTSDTMLQCLEVLRMHPQFTTVDITGGAPEMNPLFRWFVEQLHALGRHVIVRCNLTIILANKKYHDLPLFFKEHGVEVVSSLPFYTQDRTDRQRGNGVFEDSIKALRMLNEAGYGIEGSGLKLNLVYNPAGAFLPPPQQSLQLEYKQALQTRYGISFNDLYVITNMPISRYLDYLLGSGNYEQYMQKLITAFNAVAAGNVMCRTTISVGWDGYLYDCDFNQMLDMKVDCSSKHITDFNLSQLEERGIIIGQHCYGCTAGSGSSCGGATVQA